MIYNIEYVMWTICLFLWLFPVFYAILIIAVFNMSKEKNDNNTKKYKKIRTINNI
jgi:hypothetical protein